MKQIKLFLVAGLISGNVSSAQNPIQPTPQAPLQVYSGMCDASAAINLNDDIFAVANDEDNILRLYDRTRAGAPVGSLDLSSFLGLSKKTKEVDLEAAARVGDFIYWISSHGCDAKGKPALDRHRFFATKISRSPAGFALQPVGLPYRRLVNDLIADPRFAQFNLQAAGRRAPKENGGLNIEGLCATPEGYLLIGFRNPVPAGKALVIPLLNPAELIAGSPARFGEAQLLNLGGLGIRGMEGQNGRYYIVAGAYDTRKEFAIYEWEGGRHTPRRVNGINLAGINPEAIQLQQTSSALHLQIFSDDGGEIVGCDECKKLKNPADRRFREAHFVLTQDAATSVSRVTAKVNGAPALP